MPPSQESAPSSGERLEIERLERENARLRAALDSEFRIIADSAPMMIWMTDAEARCTYLNRQWLEFTGRTLEEGMTFGWNRDIHPDDLESHMEQALAQFMARQPARSEFRLRRHDGQYRMILDIGTPYFTDDGEFRGYIGACIDITEQKLAQQQLYETQKLESLGRLAGGIAHDFNNLLMAITGYTELARMKVADDAEMAEYLAKIGIATDRAAALTQQLLMYARRQVVEFATVNLNVIIGQLQSRWQSTLGEKYDLTLELAETLWNVNTNASQIEQVLLNLILNARDAMPAGGRIVIETANVILDRDYAAAHVGATPGEYVRLTVSDHGIGMSAEVQSRIFEPFFTTKQTNKNLGLGLATCYGIVKQSNGNIWVYSEPEMGTTFKVYLPRARQDTVEERLPQDDLPAGTETILLVDDEPMVRDIAARILRGRGYRVLEAANGPEALHLQREWTRPIDLLLTDVIMPLMSGKELAEHLREAQPDLSVIYMSGYTQNIILQQGVLQPDVVLITKPFSSMTLLQKVREALVKA
jgi:PAS domain S-box-containing protein